MDAPGDRASRHVPPAGSHEAEVIAMIKKPVSGMRIGELLVRDGILGQEQLQQALMVQRIQHAYKPLGEICMDLGFISRTTLRTLLDKYRKRIRLGDLLLKMGMISEIQLMAALATQRTEGGKLGEILLRKSLITQPRLMSALGMQLTVLTVEPDPYLMDKDLLRGVNINYLYQNKVIPVSRNEKEDVITVVMNDPCNTETIVDLEKMFKSRIEPAILARGEVDAILDLLLNAWFKSAGLCNAAGP
jgi:type IV pilus assembly protein PilB